MPFRLLPFEIGLSTILGIFTANAAAMGGKMIATAAEVPGWASYLLGPLGGLAGTLVAVWWLAKRLNRVEEQAQAQRQRDTEALLEILKTQTEVATKCHAAIEANNRALDRFEQDR